MGLEYNGTNQYVGCGNDGSLNIIGEITISAWIKHTTSAYGGIVVKRESSGVSDMGYNLRIHNDGTVDFYLRNTSKIGSVIFSNAALNDDVLHYVVGIRDSSNNLIMYVDDILQNVNKNNVKGSELERLKETELIAKALISLTREVNLITETHTGDDLKTCDELERMIDILKNKLEK